MPTASARLSFTPHVLRASLVAQLVKNMPAIQETWVRFLGWQDPLEKRIDTHFSILAWRIPRTSPWGRKEADRTERLSRHFRILKVCELQPGGARALDLPACNPPAVSGPSGRHASGTPGPSQVQPPLTLASGPPPTSLSHETEVSVQ